jgi:hypothetical protein
MTFIDELQELQVRRKFYISVANKQLNAAKALIRRALGQQWTDDKEVRAKSSARASRIYSAAINGKPQKPEDEAVAELLAADLVVIAQTVEIVEKARHQVELQMKRIVRKLPVYAWAEQVHGFGELGLAVVIAEAGDLSAYPKKGHLWKRFGLAPFESRAFSTWRMKGGLSAEEWKTAGYSPKRRGEIHGVVSVWLATAQVTSKAKSESKHGDPKGRYGEVYVRRMFHTEETHPEWKPAQRRQDALRIMTKALLRDLWAVWRGIGLVATYRSV